MVGREKTEMDMEATGKKRGKIGKREIGEREGKGGLGAREGKKQRSEKLYRKSLLSSTLLPIYKHCKLVGKQHHQKKLFFIIIRTQLRGLGGSVLADSNRAHPCINFS